MSASCCKRASRSASVNRKSSATACNWLAISPRIASLPPMARSNTPMRSRQRLKMSKSTVPGVTKL
ncbi:hypothetical protein D3C87_2120350 [compost metagenome]